MNLKKTRFRMRQPPEHPVRRRIFKRLPLLSIYEETSVQRLIEALNNLDRDATVTLIFEDEEEFKTDDPNLLAIWQEEQSEEEWAEELNDYDRKKKEYDRWKEENKQNILDYQSHQKEKAQKALEKELKNHEKKVQNIRKTLNDLENN